MYSYLSPTSDPPQNGRVEFILQSPTIHGNWPFLAVRPPTILSHSNLLIISSANTNILFMNKKDSSCLIKLYNYVLKS